MRTLAAALLVGTLAACGARTPPAPSRSAEAETTAAVAHVDVPWQTFPELCGEGAEPACVRADLPLPPATLDAPVRDVAALTRALPGLETKLAAHTDAGWVELPFVVEQVPPADGEARRARVVELRAGGGVLLVRVQSASLRHEAGADVPGTAHDLEEDAYLCTFPAHGAACTRVRTATASDGPLATAAWTTERSVHVDGRGRVTVTRRASP